MSLFWEPKWVRVKLTVDDFIIETCVDKTTNLIACPLCVDIDLLCPEEGASTTTEVKGSLFFTAVDLVNHMRTHAFKISDKKIKVSEEEEEEEGEVPEAEEG